MELERLDLDSARPPSFYLRFAGARADGVAVGQQYSMELVALVLERANGLPYLWTESL
jgi:hypothetical protein